MYIGSPFNLDEDLGQPPAKSYKPPFTKGAELVRESDAQKLLSIVQGPSPYQQYILQAAQRLTLPAGFFRIITSVKQAPAYLRPAFKTTGGLVGGTVDRCTSTIYMTEPPKQRDATYVEWALHELVHLFAHARIPAGTCSRIITGSFQATFGRGIGEGVTQYFTERIMHHQKISLHYRERPYEEFTKPVRELVKAFPEALIAGAYFDGDVATLVAAMNARWGGDWVNVRTLITQEKPKEAIAEIKRLEAAHIDQLLRQGPRGDFPTPNPYKYYA